MIEMHSERFFSALAHVKEQSLYSHPQSNFFSLTASALILFSKSTEMGVQAAMAIKFTLAIDCALADGPK